MARSHGALLSSAFQNWTPGANGNQVSFENQPPPPPPFRKTSSLDAEPFELTNWASNHRLELPFDDLENPVVKWQLNCSDADCLEGAYMFSPDYTRNVQGGRAFPKLLLHRPHPDPNDPDAPLPLVTLMDHYRLQDLDCSTDGVLTPSCNYCNGRWCSPSANNFSIRTTCPHAKFLTERDGHVFFAPRDRSNEQFWRLSQAPPPQPSGSANFDFL